MNNLPNIAIGIDFITINRFDSWKCFDDKQLLKIFSQREIEYARSNELLFSQRLAVRFAAKEAFLKALQQISPQKKLPFLTIAKIVSVNNHSNGMPFLKVDWNMLAIKKNFQTSLSLTHERCHATAIVIIYN